MLNEQILLIQRGDALVSASLPEAIAWLHDGSLTGFDGLAAHQRHGWNLFLYQAAAMALARAGAESAVDDDVAWRGLADADAWRARLAALAPGGAEAAWSLVVDDLAQPALLQPPLPAGNLDGYSMIGTTPDEIDVLVTAKGHDVKPARAGAAEVRHWLFALVTLQTMQGYSGRGNFGIARMNGGFGSRPLLMISPAKDDPARYRRGVAAALAARKRQLALAGGYYAEDGLPLLWLEPWDRETSLSLDGLDPLFVEVCRRVRLRRGTDGQIIAYGRPSTVPRVRVPEAAKGNLGDAWTPLDGGAALTLGAGGFNYKKMSELLTDKGVTQPAAMELPESYRGPAWLHAVALVRGQGKTEGLHERWLQIPHSATNAFRPGASRIDLGRLSKAMVEDAGNARRALRLGLQLFLQGGPEKLDLKDERAREWLDRLDQAIDDIFFAHLFRRFADEAAGEEVWQKTLVALTRRLFEAATARLSPPENRRERAFAVASRALSGTLGKAGLLPAAKADAEDETAEETAG